VLNYRGISAERREKVDVSCAKMQRTKILYFVDRASCYDSW